MQFSKKFKMEFFKFIFPLSKNKNKTKNWKLKCIHEFNFLDRWPWGWKYADHMMLVSPASMPDQDSVKHMVFISRGEGGWRIERKIRKSQINTEGLAVMFPVSWISKFCGLFSRLVKHMQFLFVIFKHCLDACLDINTFYVTAWKKSSVYLVEEFKILAKATLPLEKYRVPG